MLALVHVDARASGEEHHAAWASMSRSLRTRMIGASNCHSHLLPFLFLFSHQVLWKPLLEAAAVIRGAGWGDMKAGESGGSDVHGPASRAGGGADNDASVKRRTLTMKFYTQLKEDDDAFDTEV
jgi:hypothetical protein